MHTDYLMKKLFTLFLLVISFTAMAAPNDLPLAPPPQLAAKAWLLLDMQKRTVIG